VVETIARQIPESNKQRSGQTFLKTPRKIMAAARGEKCTLNIVGVCNHARETTVVCHLPDGAGGSNKLTGPLSIAFGCSSCHAVLDGRENVPLEDKEFYMRRGMMRTMTRLVELEILRW